MPKFVVEQYETHVSTYLVEANSEAEAIYKVLNDEESMHVSTEYVEINEELGMPVDSYRDLAHNLDALGVPIGEDIIPSIRAIFPANDQ